MLDFNLLPKFYEYRYEILSHIDDWAYANEVPKEAIIKQIPVAHAWVRSNPNKAPKRNVIRFLNTWMRKAKEFGTLQGTQHLPPPPKEDVKEEDILTGDDIRRMKEAIRK